MAGRPPHPRFRIEYGLQLTISARDAGQAEERAEGLEGEIRRQLEPLLAHGHRTPGRPNDLRVVLLEPGMRLP